MRVQLDTFGWLVVFLIAALGTLVFVMFRRHFISSSIAITLHLLMLVLSIWLFPYFAPLRLERKAKGKQ